MENKFCVSDELVDRINMGKHPIEISIADTLCIFNYDRSTFDSDEVAKALTEHIKAILEENKGYKVVSVNNNTTLNLIFVVFDINSQPNQF